MCGIQTAIASNNNNGFIIPKVFGGVVGMLNKTIPNVSLSNINLLAPQTIWIITNQNVNTQTFQFRLPQ